MSGSVDEEMRDEEGKGEGRNGERSLPVTPPEFVLLRTADEASYRIRGEMFEAYSRLFQIAWS